MKKILVLVLCVLSVAVAVSGCSKNTEDTKTVTQKVTEKADAIDLDLTALSSTMVYSEVYNMMNTPDDYVGKTVKMTGTTSTYYDEATDTKYYACVIADAAACCSQGLEFVLDESEYDDGDYPSDGENIEVLGKFETYQENGLTYCHLTGSEMKIV